MEQTVIYNNISYRILNAEHECIIHPLVLGLLPITKDSLQRSFSCDFHVYDYHLILDRMELTDGNQKDQQQLKIGMQVLYSGVILLGANLVKEYYEKSGNLTCFSYQNVIELIFENGMLITTVDQSKAMLRIRKNIEMGLRSLNKSRDLRCIKRFMNSSFVGDYKSFLLDSMRIKYLKEVKSEYEKEH
jgi:hypothetical protein